MDTTPEPEPPVEDFVRRAERLAAEHHVPSWLRPGHQKTGYPALLGLIAAIALQLGDPKKQKAYTCWFRAGR